MQISMDEHGNFVKEPATNDDLALWATALQAKYFPGFEASGMQVAIDVELHPRGPPVYFPERNLIAISERVTPFHELATIALLHEMIHVKLYAENKDARLGEVLSERIMQLHSCVDDMVDTFVAAARED